MKKNITIIYLAGFLFSIPLALTSYVNSSFLENFVDPDYEGIIYAVASVLSIVLMLEMPRFLTRFGNRKVTVFFGTLMFLSLLGLALGTQKELAIVSFVIYFILTNLIVANLDIFVEDFSKKNAIGKFRGLYLTIINSAWVISQMVSGSIIEKSSFSGLYVFSALFMVLFTAVFIIFLKDFTDPKYSRLSVVRTTRFFIKNKNLGRIYFANLVLKFFYAWMVIYTPIYLHENMNLGWDKIGTIFAIMLLPFVFLSFPLGRWSDKIGEKRILIDGFVICIASTSIIPFVGMPLVWLWALILFITRVGAATIEVMSESYFFKSVHEEDAESINFFRTTSPLAYIIAPLLATGVLIFTPSFKYIFFILTAILLSGLLVTIRLKDKR